MPLKAINEDELSDAAASPTPDAKKKDDQPEEKTADPKKGSKKKDANSAPKAKTVKTGSDQTKTPEAADMDTTPAVAAGSGKKKATPPMKRPSASSKVSKDKPGAMKRPAAKAASGGDPKKVVAAYKNWYKRDRSSGIKLKYADGTEKQIMSVQGSCSACLNRFLIPTC